MLIFLLPSFYFSQKIITRSDIDTISSKHQECLSFYDKWYSCAEEFQIKIDSCLDVAFNQLNNKLDQKNKSKLSFDQKNWIKIRDKKYNDIDRKNTVGGRDGRIISMDQKAEVVKERVLELIKQLEKLD